MSGNLKPCGEQGEKKVKMCDWDEKTEEGQRMKNLFIYKMYATDKEVEEAMPGISCLLVVVVVLLFIFGGFK